MTSKPAIPTLFLIPGATHIDYPTLYAIATAYAHSGLLISGHGKQTDSMAFTFPAIVCSSFAIELFMKFFLMVDKAEQEEAAAKHDAGHKISDLWDKIKPEYQRLIAGMFRNKTGQPLLNAPEMRVEVFVEALKQLGDTPFVKWRYAYELPEMTLMSHGGLVEVLDAFGKAAQHVMNQKAGAA